MGVESPFLRASDPTTTPDIILRLHEYETICINGYTVVRVH